MSFGRNRTDGGATLEITADTLVADIAAHHPRSIEVFGGPVIFEGTFRTVRRP